MHKLINLLLQNKAKQEPLRLETQADAAHLYLYGVIDADWGIGAADLARALNGAGDLPVTLHINSPGGDVFEARAMKSLIAAHKQPVTALVEGVAASAATSICNACASVKASDDSLYMIHESWTFSMGNKRELAKTVALLEKVDAQIGAEYAAKSGKSAEDITAAMEAETWFTAQEAVAFGLVDETTPSSQAKAKNWNLSAYDNAPKTDDVADSAKNLIQTAKNRLRLYEIT